MATTIKDVRMSFERVREVARRLGYNDVDNFVLLEGSKDNGIAYRLMHREPTGGGVSGIITSDGYLGMTKPEADTALHVIARTLEDVEYRTHPDTRPENKLARLVRWQPSAAQQILTEPDHGGA